MLNKDELTLKILGTVAPYPKDSKNCIGHLIEYNGQKILLDCGNGSTRLMNFKEDLNNLKIFISHLHPDHYGDLISLIQATYVYDKYGYIDKKPEIYLPNKDLEEKKVHGKDKDGWGYIYSVKEPLIDYKYIEDYAIKRGIKIIGYDKLNLDLNNIGIKTLKVPHDIDSYAYKIETKAGSIVYSSDTGSKNNLRSFAKESDIFICESTFLKGQLRVDDTHLFAYETAKIAKDANVKKLLLTHFWPEENKEAYLNEAKEVFNNVEVAEEGKVLTLRR